MILIRVAPRKGTPMCPRLRAERSTLGAGSGFVNQEQNAVGLFPRKVAEMLLRLGGVSRAAFDFRHMSSTSARSHVRASEAASAGSAILHLRSRGTGPRVKGEDHPRQYRVGHLAERTIIGYSHQPYPARGLRHTMVNVWVRAILGFVISTSPSIAQNAPWPPPAGMSAGEYLQRYGRLYNPYTGYDPRRDAERYRSLPEPPKPYAPPAPVRANPSAGPRPEYNWDTGKYELPCSPTARSDPYARLKPVYNAYTGRYEFACEGK
jgi:hypothetical protein